MASSLVLFYAIAYISVSIGVHRAHAIDDLCTDKLDYCDEYGHDYICTLEYTPWSTINCRRFCNLCQASTTISILQEKSTPSTTQTSVVRSVTTPPPPVLSGVTCASCLNVSNPTECINNITCNVGEICYTTAHGSDSDVKFDLGCKVKKDCGYNSLPLSSLVGRDLAPRCSECCSTSNCNAQLCTSAICEDDQSYNCQRVSGLFNICGDVTHAKIACRKWCNLCDLVDGEWSDWTGWGSCDVTCGNGTRTRSRLCTNPAPAHGGVSCPGDVDETINCTLEQCPIHGGWSSWHEWTACSKLCGIGTQARHRTCDNPTPKLFGDHCFGDGVDFKACFVRSCRDGGWSFWSQWSSCTDNTKARTRTCDNPVPSTFGRACTGNDRDLTFCSQ